MWFGLGSKSEPPATIHVGDQDLQDLADTPQFPPPRVNRHDLQALHTKQLILLEQITVLLAQMEGVNRNLGAAETKVLDSEFELGTLKESRNEVQRAIKTLTSDSVKKIEERRQVCLRESTALQQEVKENDTTITSFSERLASLVAGNREREKSKLALANQIATHRQTSQKLIATIKQQNHDLDALVTQRDEPHLDETTLAQLDQSLQRIHRDVALSSGHLRVELESINMLNQQVGELNSQIGSSSIKLHALRRTLPEKQLASRQNQARIKELQDETAKLEKELEAALRRLKALESGLTDLEKKIVLKQQTRTEAVSTFEALHKTQLAGMMRFAELQTQQQACASEVDKITRHTLPTVSLIQATTSCPARCISSDRPVDGKLTATKVLLMFEETIAPDADHENSFRLCVEVFEIMSCKMYRQKKGTGEGEDTKEEIEEAEAAKSKPTSYLVIELKPGYHNLFAASKPLREPRRGSVVKEDGGKKTPERRDRKSVV